MSRSEDVFPEPDSAEETLSVRDVGERIQSLLRSGFPEPIWVAGETVDLVRAAQRASGPRSRGHWYFQLAEDGPRGRASVDVVLWKSRAQRLLKGGRLRGQVEPADGIVLRLLLKPNWWIDGGRLSFSVEDVDPRYTLGDLDRQRRELLARLEAEGALLWNKARELADVPLRLGLVTSAGSAAHHDVMEGLTRAGIGFRVLLCDARMQGAETGPSVRAGLATLARRGVDAILLVRGGGSRMDLSWFDREDVARAIATCPVPVLTGIGHEIDSSVADATAHQSFKTPSAVAEFLVERAHGERRAVEDAYARIVALSREGLDQTRRELGDTARLLRHSSARVLGGAVEGFRRQAARLAELSDLYLERSREGLATAQSRLLAGQHVTRLARLERELTSLAAGLGPRAEIVLSRRAAQLDESDTRRRLLDPANVLARGFAWLRREDGSILLDAASARRAEPLTAVMRDGELDVVAGDARLGAETRSAHTGS